MVRTILLLLADFLSFYSFLYLAFQARISIEKLFPHLFPDFYQSFDHYLALWWLPLLFLFLFFYEGLYTVKRFFWEELREILKVLLVYMAFMFAILTLGKISILYSRTVLACHCFLLCIFVPLVRYYLLFFLKKLGWAQEKVWFWGDQKEIHNFEKFLLANPYLGFDLEKKWHGEELPPLDFQKKTIFLSSNLPGIGEKILYLLTKAPKIYVQGGLNTQSCIFANCRIHIPLGANLMFLEVENKLLIKHNRIRKRIFDLCITLLALPILAPLFLLYFLFVRKPLFGHQRVGKGGQPFSCIKLRTMKINSQEILEKYLVAHPEAKKEWETYYKLKDDPRITPLGKWLRKTSLDEIPQLINVLKGEMSLVGPRPILEEEIQKYYHGPHRKIYYLATPGITGLWQVSGRNDLTYEERVALDSWYVLNWSFWLDIMILLKTVKVVFFRSGAY
ncbi:MAG: exopolysaccharide biosynthesis polyprenyl glycosylphosphotransferase [Planctomycetota bacterium]|nr:MAG: exopolysaccharide biosynthesis polyprenyl glycosylphosphotransferase [Planctomycetota bacterium]